jgi:F-type H+-transporting ATPase subunit epsilon
MAEEIELEVATPERQLVHAQVDEVQIPAKDGYLGILPGHAPLLAELSTGFLWYHSGGRRRYLAIHGGFLEVLPNKVRVLADAAEIAEEIDVERARKALQRAQEQLGHAALGVGADPAVALQGIQRAEARIEAAAHKEATAQK